MGFLFILFGMRCGGGDKGKPQGDDAEFKPRTVKRLGEESSLCFTSSTQSAWQKKKSL